MELLLRVACPVVPREWVGDKILLASGCRRKGQEGLPDVLRHRKRAGLEVKERITVRPHQDF